MTQPLIVGSKGKGGGGGRAPREAPDSLISTSKARLIDLISEGEIVGLVDGINSVYLDETPLATDGVHNFEGLTVQWRTGTQMQGPISGFPSVENTIAQGIEFRDLAPWLRDFTNLDLNGVRVQLSTPQFYKVNTGNGDTDGHRVEYAIDLSIDGGPFSEVVQRAFEGKTTTKYGRSHEIVFPPATSRRTIRVRRLTPNANSGTNPDSTFVETVTELIYGNFSYPNSAVVGIEVDAKHFQGIPRRAYDIKGIKVRVPSNYDPESRTYMGVWNGSYKRAWTDNPAWIFLDLATNERYGLGERIPLGLMDKWALYDIARYCDQLVPDGFGGQEPRFTCNSYIQARENAYDLLQKLASVFQGMAYYSSGSVTPVADQPKDALTVYENSDTVDGRFTYSGSPKATRYTVAMVGWNNPKNFFRQEVEVVEDAEGLQSYGYNETQFTAFATSSRGQAHRAGRWALLSSNLETQTCVFTVGLKGLKSRPGDIVRIADENLIGEPKGGLITKATNNTITVNNDVNVAPGDRLIAMLPSGVAQERTVSSVNGRDIKVTSAFSEVPQVEGTWAVDGDIRLQHFRVLMVKENEEGHTFELTCLEYRPDKYDAIANGTKLDTRPITGIPPSVQPPPTDVTITQRVTVDQGMTQTTAVIAWESPKNAIAYEGSWRKDDGEWIYFRTESQGVEIRGVYAGKYRAQVRAIGPTDIRSIPAFSPEVTLAGKTTPPPVPTFLSTEALQRGIRLKWGFPSSGAEDVQRTELWASLTDDRDDAVKVSDLAAPQDTYEHIGLDPFRDVFYWARFIDRSGNIGDFYPTGRGVDGQPENLKLDRDSIASEMIQDGALTITKFADSIKPPVVVDELPTEGMREFDQVILAGEEKIYQYKNGEWAPLISAVNLDGKILGEQLEANTITVNELATDTRIILEVDELPSEGKANSYITFENELYHWDGTEWTKSIKTVDLIGRITKGQLSPELGTVIDLVGDPDMGTVNSRIESAQTELDARLDQVQGGLDEANSDLVDASDTLAATQIRALSASNVATTNVNEKIKTETSDRISQAHQIIEDLNQEIADRENSDSEINIRVDGIESTVGDNHASVTDSLATLANEDTAFATRVSTLESTVDDNRSIYDTTVNTLANEDIALSERIDTLTSTVGDNAASATSSITTLTDADTALGQRIDTLTTTVGDNEASTSSSLTALVDEDTATSQRIDALTVTVGENKTEATSSITTLTDADTAMGQRIDTLTSTVGDNKSSADSSISTVTTDIAAEVTARQTLQSQMTGGYTGNDIEAVTNGLIYQEAQLRSDLGQTLAQQISLVSAGVGEQFDPFKMWHFDDTVEGWTGNGTPTLVSGYLRPANHASAPYVSSPAALGVGSGQYRHMKLRIKRVGSPAWRGKLSWREATDGSNTWTRSTTIDEPSFDDDGISVINFTEIEWANTIDQVRLELGATQTAANYFLLDWVSVGRPSPGASYAALADEKTARITTDNAHSQSIGALEVRLGSAEGSITTNNQARVDGDAAVTSSLNTHISAYESNKSTVSSSITTLTNKDTSLANAISALTTTVGDNKSSADSSISTLTTKDSALTTSINNLSTTVGDNKSSADSSITTLTNRDTALTNLITSLTTTVGDNKASADSSISTLTSKDTALTDSVDSISTTVGGHTTSISTNSTSIDGIKGKYSVTIDNNGYLTGYRIISSTSPDAQSVFQILANRFQIGASDVPNKAPFIVSTDRGTARIAISGDMVVDGSITADAIAANAITTDKLAANSVTADEIAANTITSSQIAADAITAVQIAASSITTDKLASNSVTTAKVNAGAITTNKLATNSVTAVKVAAKAITTDAIAAGAVTANELAANSIVAGKVAAGAIGADQISAGAITTSKLTITGSNLIPNGDFTTGSFANWSPFMAVDRSEIVEFNGGSGTSGLNSMPAKFACRFTGTPGNPEVAVFSHELPHAAWDTDGFGVKPSEAYYLSIDVNRYGAAGSRFYAAVYYRTKEGVNVWGGGPIGFVAGGISTVGYTTLEGSFTVPANVVRCRIYVYALDHTSGYIYWTNLRCNRMMSSNLVVDGAIKTQHMTANTIEGDRIRANTMSADRITANTFNAKVAAINHAYIEEANIFDGNITTAKLGYAVVTNAKIGNLQVDTLKIANNAVTTAASSWHNMPFTTKTYNAVNQWVGIFNLGLGNPSQTILLAALRGTVGKAGGSNQNTDVQIRVLCNGVELGVSDRLSPHTTGSSLPVEISLGQVVIAAWATIQVQMRHLDYNHTVNFNFNATITRFTAYK